MLHVWSPLTTVEVLCRNKGKVSDRFQVMFMLFSRGSTLEKANNTRVGFFKSTWLRVWWNCLSLFCYAMCSASHSVLCTQPTADSCLWASWVGWLSQKNPRERQTLKRGRRNWADRKRDKERQRRAVTSDAVCPHLISSCFQPSWCSPPTELNIHH